eukprot:5792043-Amphidinium_carterae.2
MAAPAGTASIASVGWRTPKASSSPPQGDHNRSPHISIFITHTFCSMRKAASICGLCRSMFDMGPVNTTNNRCGTPKESRAYAALTDRSAMQGNSRKIVSRLTHLSTKNVSSRAVGTPRKQTSDPRPARSHQSARLTSRKTHQSAK